MTIFECICIYVLSGLLSFPIVYKLIVWTKSRFCCSGVHNVKK